MGVFDSIVNRVKDDLTYKAEEGVSEGVSKGISKIFNKEKGLSKCPKCKTKITDSSLKFCPKCGTKLIVTCSKCNLDYPQGTKFCTQCGGKLK
ncbi:zinc ribbon domain-containing protein [Candidatus Pacearchaeota archaeon]|jgi:rRNA maturation endonuclease Nob1|nr:zinc ribbon domain-containing protein [Candidatus Pacearchaeota archaeon]